MGEAGVRHVMKSLLADFDILMNVGGFQNIEQIDRSALGECFSDAIVATDADSFVESYPKAYAMIAERSKL